MLLDADVYGLDRGSPMSFSLFDYLPRTIVGYLAFLKLLTLITFKDVVVEWILGVSFSKQETCAMLDYFVSRD
jgi:hypothetical protein